MRTAELSRTGQQKRTGSLSRIDSARKPLIQTGELQTQPQVPRACRPRSIEQLQTKPKDYSTSVQYKNISEEERFKTVLNGENVRNIIEFRRRNRGGRLPGETRKRRHQSRKNRREGRGKKRTFRSIWKRELMRNSNRFIRKRRRNS